MLALLDPLLPYAALVVEPHDPLRPPPQVRDDETDPREQLTLVPFDFGHRPAGFGPALCLVLEAGVQDDRLFGATDRSSQQVFDVPVQHGVGSRVMHGVAATPVAGPEIANASHAAMGGSGGVIGYSGLLATLVHTAGYLLVTGLVAWVVYEKLGVLFLRRAWLNMDLIWAAALLVAGVATLLV